LVIHCADPAEYIEGGKIVPKDRLVLHYRLILRRRPAPVIRPAADPVSVLRVTTEEINGKSSSGPFWRGTATIVPIPIPGGRARYAADRTTASGGLSGRLPGGYD
jgi:hypothetical protein